MRISLNTSLSFKRQLRPSEEAEFSNVLKLGKEKLGNTGHSMLIVPSASLPQCINTGVGNMLDEEGKRFFDFAKQYWGVNYIQLLPEGRYKGINSSYLPYSGSALDLGSHLINIELLSKKDFGEILTEKDINKVVQANNCVRKDFRINFDNVLPTYSENEKALRKAYKELIKADTNSKRELIKNIELYAESNREWLEPKLIFEALSTKYKSADTRNWNEFDRNFYNIDVVPVEKRLQAIEGIKNSELKSEIKFFEFKQYLAETHLAMARDELNKKGIKLSGDALAGFSYDEIWANPKAFVKGYSIGYGLPALDLDSPEAEKLLRQKFHNFAKRYDGIRLDMSWAYVTQPLINSATKNKDHKEYGEKVLLIIEDEIKKVKGSNFDLENITHEMEAASEDFKLFKEFEIKELAKKRNKIFSTMHLGKDWETVENFRKRGWKEGSYVLGTTNHDSETLRETYANLSKRKEQVEVLSQILKIPKEKLNNFSSFMQAKFAEPMRSKHNMMFFTEALNLTEKYKGMGMGEDYCIKIPKNYQNLYFKSLEAGEGFNVMDALEKAFVAEGLDRKEPDLYKKIVKYRKILQAKEKGRSKLYGLSATILAGLILVFSFIFHKKRAGTPDSNVR